VSLKPRAPFVLVLVALFLVPCAAGALAEGAPDAGAARYAEGAALLKQGQVDEAAQAFLAAARAEPQNAVYVQQALVLKRVQGLRRFVAQNELSKRWETSARSLHLFYVQSGLGSLAVELDTLAHQKMQSATSATWLAEAYLETGRNAEATTLLATYSGQSPQLAAYHALALARLGKPDDARRIAAGAAVGEDAEPGYLYDVARLKAALGEGPQALALLQTSFERTTAAVLPFVKERARTSPDLAALAGTPAFAAVLQTESKVKQTCSGGSSCSSCPNRGGCGK
jgi:tetratricopeptide (TPR) repeat protein